MQTLLVTVRAQPKGQKMKRFLLIILLSFLPLSAFAADEEPKYKVSGVCLTVKGDCYDDGDSLCRAALAGAWTAKTGWSWVGVNTVKCSIEEYPGTAGVGVTCSKGGTLLQEKFGCYSSTPPVNTCPAAGTVLIEMKEDDPGFDTNAAGLACYQGCAIKVPGITVCVDNPETGKQGCNTGGAGNVTYTGNQCTDSEGSEVPPVDPTDPKPGEGEGGGSGGGNEGGEGGEGGSGSGGDGPGTGEGSGGTGGGNGSGGTGSGDGDGKGEGEEGEDESGDSKWGGNCAGGFKGEGDALAVAIAQAEWERNCVFIHDVKESEEYKQAMALKDAPENSGKFGSISSELPKEETNISVYLKKENLLGSGACYPDKTFVVRGRTIKIPFSMYCDLMKWIGMMIEGLAFIIGMRIAFGGEK